MSRPAALALVAALGLCGCAGLQLWPTAPADGPAADRPAAGGSRAAAGSAATGTAPDDPAVLRELADRLAEGEGTPRDPARALALYRQAAAMGDHVARYRGAALLLETAEADAAERRAAAGEIEQAARAGYVQAQIGLGQLLLEGTWRRRDPIEAQRWFAVALEPLRAEAASGDGWAQQRLGDLHRDGQGVAADGRAAARWYLRALGSGRPSAEMRLARLYQRGAAGLPPDAAEAARWLGRAAARGDAVAMYDLARMRLRGEGGAADPQAARALLEGAAAAGESRAYRYLGELLSDPAVPGADPLLAAAWLERAARDGDGKAMFRLGELWEKSPLLEADDEQALVWYTLAARHGYARGAERTGRVAARLDAAARARARARIDGWRASNREP